MSDTSPILALAAKQALKHLDQVNGPAEVRDALRAGLDDQEAHRAGGWTCKVCCTESTHDGPMAPICELCGNRYMDYHRPIHVA